MKRALPLVPDEAVALLWAPWRMLETDHDAFMIELRELESLLKQHPIHKPCPLRLLHRIDRFINHFESHMGAHFKAEEKAVFPFLQRHAPHLKKTIQLLVTEHDGIRQTLMDWKRSFRRVKSRAKPRKNEISLPARGLELVRLLRLHIEGESKIMRHFPSIAA